MTTNTTCRISLFGILFVLTSEAWAGEATGVVVDQNNKSIADAHLRVQAIDRKAKAYALVPDVHVMSDAQGQFSLKMNNDWEQPWIIAGKAGYMNYGAALTSSGKTRVPIFELPADDPGYSFIPASVCSQCHTTLYEQWQTSLHSNSAKSGWAHQMMEATNADGKPDGVGFRADRPAEIPPCAFCHAPGPASGEGGLVDLGKLSDSERGGVECDVCHKVASVEVNDQAGVDGALQLLRPGDDYWSGLFGEPTVAENVLFAFGPFEDAGVGGPMLAALNPDMKTSAFCSGCHQHANEVGVPNMTTYSEWEASPYAEAGVQCQDCHMVAGKLEHFVDGHMRMHEVLRDPANIYGHRFEGTTDTMLGAAALLELVLAEEDGALIATATVTNGGAGHALPTGMPIRNVLLLLEATTADGQVMELTEGSRLPDYAGTGDPDDGNYEGLAGKGFARVLESSDGERGVWFWNATGEVEDTRIPAGQSDVSEYRFAKPTDLVENAAVQVTARLIYRRAYKPLADLKGWTEGSESPDSDYFRPYEVELASKTVEVTIAPPTEASTREGACSCAMGQRPATHDNALLVVLLLVLGLANVMGSPRRP